MTNKLQKYSIGGFSQLIPDDKCGLVYKVEDIPQWISVETRLPTAEDADQKGFIFCWSEESDECLMVHIDWLHNGIEKASMTHWQPLPGRPK